MQLLGHNKTRLCCTSLSRTGNYYLDVSKLLFSTINVVFEIFKTLFS